VDGVSVARVFAVLGSGGSTAAAAKDFDELERATILGSVLVKASFIDPMIMSFVASSLPF
jgi:hypothetical protein